MAPDRKRRGGLPDTGPQGAPGEQLDHAILRSEPAFNALEVAAETGVTIEQTRRLWRALGFPEFIGEKAYTAADIEAVSTLMGFVDAGAVDFDTAVNLTRGVGQTMARLADWEVSTLVSRVEEMEARRGGHRLAHRVGAAAHRRGQPALRAAPRLRLAPPPRRRRRPDRGDGRQGRGPPHHRRHASGSPTWSPSPRCPTPSTATRSATSSRSSRAAARTSWPATAAGSSRASATRCSSSPTPPRRRSASPRGSSTSSAATRRCPTSASAWPAARSSSASATSSARRSTWPPG